MNLKRVYAIILCLSFLLLTGCEREKNITEINGNNETKNENGVYYKKFDSKMVGVKYDPLTTYSCSLLLNNGEIYTSSNLFQDEEKEKLNLETKIGKKITDVYGNKGIYFSTDESKLFEKTSKGEIYEIKGYASSFRVGVYYEETFGMSNVVCNFMIFDQLNGIVLDKGYELYKDRFHLDESVKVEIYTKHNNVMCDFTLEDSIISQTLNEIFNGTFISPESAEYPNVSLKEHCKLIFYDSIGLTTELYVSQDGYVWMLRKGADDAFVLKIDQELCGKLIEKVNTSS